MVIPPEKIAEAIRDADDNLGTITRSRLIITGNVAAQMWERFIKTFYGKEVMNAIIRKGYR
ncbi:MAG: hypothetical protein WC554_10655 [Clostridia bacterium]|jgi:hypothetical protein